jgi:ATP-dependent 26S proteasome regulatory subunit
MVALDMTTLTIMRMLPREVDPMVFNMSLEDPGQVSFSGIGGLSDQIRELREVIPKSNYKLMFVGDRTAVEESRIVHSSWN